MLWALIIIAMAVAVAMHLLGFFLKVKNFNLMLVLQFFASFAAAYGVAYSFMGTSYNTSNVLISCAVVSLVITLLISVLRHYLGSWYDRNPGRGVK